MSVWSFKNQTTIYNQNHANTVKFKGKTWTIRNVRTAAQVKTEFPDPRMGELMEREGLELLILSGGGEITDMLIFRVHSPISQTIAFRDRAGNILDPNTFQLPD